MKLFVLGLDGATFDCLNPLMEEGILPNITDMCSVIRLTRNVARTAASFIELAEQPRLPLTKTAAVLSFSRYPSWAKGILYNAI